MTIRNAQVGVPVLFNASTNCSKSPCDGQCPDFTLKRHDTYPPFRVAASDCDGPLDLSDPNLILEASMWTNAKLRMDLTNDSGDSTFSYIQLSGDVAFQQVMVNDIIVMDRPRLPEQMLVTGFDEQNKLIQVLRGRYGTSASYWKKGSTMKIFRMLNAQQPQTAIQTETGDAIAEDGSMKSDVLQGTYLVYNWAANDTCLAGCYMLEFKLVKMTPSTNFQLVEPVFPPNVIPASFPISFTPSTMSVADFGCDIGSGVEWVRRFPVDRDGFLIQIVESPTNENIGD